MQKEMTGYTEGGKVHMLLMLLLLFAGLAGVAALASWALGHSRSGKKESPGAENDALEILRRRYVRGKITRDQFHLMWRDLAS